MPRGEQLADSLKCRTIRRWFSLGISRAPASPPSPLPAPPAPGQILLITGPSGAGKSTLLLHIVAQCCTFQFHDLPLPDRPLVDLFNLSLEKTLHLLSRAGLAEAHLYLAHPVQLSEGQRFRLRLALALHQLRTTDCPPPTLLCDEFAALLDRTSAMIVSRLLRRFIDESRASAILATSHDDLLEALQPDIVVRCDFGRFTAESRRAQRLEPG